MPAALWWKSFYSRERSGTDLDALLDAAPAVALPERGALVFPHTRLAASGPLVASVARAAARSGRPVLALGVLHGARERDASDLARARAGDDRARETLRGIHDETGLASEEFSLDTFRALYERACAREGRPARLTTRYPFLTGEHPEDLPGLQDLARLARDAAVVGTADPMHHGVGYGTARPLDEALAGTASFARARIEEQLRALATPDFGDFARLCLRDASDFRDVGPVLAVLKPASAWTLEEVDLVDYADVLETPRPTWVAAGRIRVQASPK
ncbi:MAG TPA: hypothetical protein VMU54_03605 [Planctomycetota bacterium]|nr:hypothetical protein [Planctomycetota bacterium]